jgi:hypothetical protein
LIAEKKLAEFESSADQHWEGFLEHEEENAKDKYYRANAAEVNQELQHSFAQNSPGRTHGPSDGEVLLD